MTREISVEIQCVDATKYPVDVLVLKYAQANYGLDKFVTELLRKQGNQVSLMQPKPGKSSLLKGVSDIAAKFILFVGVEELYEFRYREIRDFSRRAISDLVKFEPSIETVALTIHGSGYELDEHEAFESEIAGIIDVIQSQDFPQNLSRIIILERDRRRADILQRSLDALIPGGVISSSRNLYLDQRPETREHLRSLGYTSDSKAHVFVAMPFKEEMDDIYHYGIQGAVKSAGFLCERADLSTFTGNVMEWVRQRIKSSRLVVADLSNANPNVYLEVGYAWGCEVPTILIVNDTEHLKFDVRDQRCLRYRSIKNLEEALSKELSNLKENRIL